MGEEEDKSVRLGVFHVPGDLFRAVELVSERWGEFTDGQEYAMLRAALLNTIRRGKGSGAGSVAGFRRDLRILAELIFSLTKRR